MVWSGRARRTLRRECLDHVIVFNERHLWRVLHEYVGHYNRMRPTGKRRRRDAASSPLSVHVCGPSCVSGHPPAHACGLSLSLLLAGRGLRLLLLVRLRVPSLRLAPRFPLSDLSQRSVSLAALRRGATRDAIGDVTVTIEGARLDSEPRSSFDEPPEEQAAQQVDRPKSKAAVTHLLLPPPPDRRCLAEARRRSRPASGRSSPWGGEVGAGEGIRTLDPLLGKQVLKRGLAWLSVPQPGPPAGALPGPRAAGRGSTRNGSRWWPCRSPPCPLPRGS